MVKSLARKITELTPAEARTFFLSPEVYCNFDLPEYIDFSKVLSALDSEISNKSLSSYYVDDKSKRPEKLADVNYDLIQNKDGRYGWRKLSLAHPAIYIDLVNYICSEPIWKLICQRFTEFSHSTIISCESIPLVSGDGLSHKELIINQWWKSVELRSIELSLEYRSLHETDISDCYGSIYTHSFSWALHGKLKAKTKTDCKEGDTIDKKLRSMTHNQTNGIPQGSMLFDFLAEIVLGYTDELIEAELLEAGSADIKIIRYRDDYRIFTNDASRGESALKIITEVMISVGMRVNTAKTSETADVIRQSYKAGKIEWEKENKAQDALKLALQINSFSDRFPNSPSIPAAVRSLYKKVDKLMIDDVRINSLVATVAEIVRKNYRYFSLLTSVLSVLLSKKSKEEDKLDQVKKLSAFFDRLPTTGFSDVWMQRLTIKFDPNIEYDDLISKVVSGKISSVWNSEWLSANLVKLIDESTIFDDAKLKSLDAKVPVKTFLLFKSNFAVSS